MGGWARRPGTARPRVDPSPEACLGASADAAPADRSGVGAVPVTLASVGLGVALAAIAVWDLRTRRIPDAISLPLIVAGLGWAFWCGERAWPSYLIGTLAGYASLAGAGALYFRLRGREGLGLGDAKLFAAAGAWLGWQTLPLVLLVGSVGGLLYAVLARQRDAPAELAFGPWLALGIWLAWIGRH